jgi:hypothetical protein
LIGECVNQLNDSRAYALGMASLGENCYGKVWAALIIWDEGWDWEFSRKLDGQRLRYLEQPLTRHSDLGVDLLLVGFLRLSLSINLSWNG